MSSSSANNEGEEEKPKPIWTTAAYPAMIGDPFIQNTELETGHIAQSCSVFVYLLARIINFNQM